MKRLLRRGKESSGRRHKAMCKERHTDTQQMQMHQERRMAMKLGRQTKQMAT